MSNRFAKSSAYIDKGKAGTLSRETRCVHGLNWQCSATGAIVPPLHVSTTFARNDNYQKPNERGYIRDDNPSFDQAEALLCELEAAEDAYVFASGAAACASVLQILPKMSHIIMQENIYFGIPKWVREHLSLTHGVTCEFIKNGDIDALADACSRKAPQIVWIETPANPTVDITDIAAAAEIVHNAGGYLVVDSTVATPVHSRPLTLGADFVVHSATKTLNGHSDLLAGFVACRENNEYWQRLGEHRHLTGPMLGSFECYLLVRGMRTLFLRAIRQAENALKIAEVLTEKCGDKLSVVYPGLPNHAGHGVACSQMENGFGSLMALHMGGGEARIMNFLGRLQLIRRATSLGGIESLIEHRKTVEGEDSITADDLLRFSVGIESADDLIDDICTALGA